MAAAAAWLSAPIAVAVVVGLGDVAGAALGYGAYRDHHGVIVPGTSSWASLYLLGIEAAAGACILTLAIAAAGRSQPAAAGAAASAWLRLAAVIVAALILRFVQDTPIDLSDYAVFGLTVLDALAGGLVCSTILIRTR